MFESLLRSYVLIGMTVFGLRAVLYELGLSPWIVVVSLAVAIGLLCAISRIPAALPWVQAHLVTYARRHRAA